MLKMCTESAASKTDIYIWLRTINYANQLSDYAKLDVNESVTWKVIYSRNDSPESRHDDNADHLLQRPSDGDRLSARRFHRLQRNFRTTVCRTMASAKFKLIRRVM